MRKEANRRIGSILALAMTLAGPALLQVGCLDEPQDIEGASDELVATEATHLAGDNNALVVNVYWNVPYISVDQPSDTLGTKVIDIKDQSQANGARAQLWERNGGANQRWQVWGNSLERIYIFHAGHSKNKCLDMAIDGSVGNGTRVQQWDCNDGLNQQWVASGDSGWVTLKNRWNPSLCLDASGAVYADGRLLQVWQCHGQWNQRWNIF